MSQVFFDFDGVIGDTWDLNWGAVQELHPEASEDHYRINHHLGNVFEQPAVKFTDETAARYYDLYNEGLSYEHIKQSLPSLQTLPEEHTLHIVTSNCESAISRVLADARVLTLFATVLGRQAHASKVAKFKQLFLKTGTLPEHCIFVTDTLGDITEANTAGLPTIAVSFGYHPKEVLERGAPLAIVDTWEEVVEKIKEYQPATFPSAN